VGGDPQQVGSLENARLVEAGPRPLPAQQFAVIGTRWHGIADLTWMGPI
jgi:hypothetical protein